MLMESKICENCKKEFTPTKYQFQRFCSKICKERSRGRRRYKNPEYRIKHRIIDRRHQKEYSRKKVCAGTNCYWKINQRCNNPKSTGFKYYGGKGIKNLLTKEEFLDIYWESNNCKLCGCLFDDNKRCNKNGRSVDRINSCDNYDKGNIQIICLECNARKARKESPLIQKTCKGCGVDFTTQSSKKMYCSRKCYMEFYYATIL